jgi:hypothetical protein
MLDTSDFDAHMELVNMAHYNPSWQQPSTCKRPSMFPTRPTIVQRLFRWLFGE